MNIKTGLGNKIRELRQKHNMSQENLCEVLDINTSSLSSLETGKSFPSHKTLTLLCNAFNIHPKELFDFSTATINSEQQEIIKEINSTLPELDNEKLYYINQIARVFANKN